MPTLSIPEENFVIGHDDKQREITMKHIRSGLDCTVPDNTPIEEHIGCTINQITINNGIWSKSVSISPKLVRKCMIKTFIKHAKSTYDEGGISEIDGFKDYVTVQIPKIVPNWSKTTWMYISNRIHNIMIENQCSLEECCDK